MGMSRTVSGFVPGTAGGLNWPGAGAQRTAPAQSTPCWWTTHSWQLRARAILACKIRSHLLVTRRCRLAPDTGIGAICRDLTGSPRLASGGRARGAPSLLLGAWRFAAFAAAKTNE